VHREKADGNGLGGVASTSWEDGAKQGRRQLTAFVRNERKFAAVATHGFCAKMGHMTFFILFFPVATHFIFPQQRAGIVLSIPIPISLPTNKGRKVSPHFFRPF
jgi:hypothetical protein